MSLHPFKLYYNRGRCLMQISHPDALQPMVDPSRSTINVKSRNTGYKRQDEAERGRGLMG